MHAETLTCDGSAASHGPQEYTSLSGPRDKLSAGALSPQSQASTDSEPYEIISPREEDIGQSTGTAVVIADR